MDLPLSEELCVSIPSPIGQIEAASAATIPRDVARTRSSIVHETALVPLSIDAALAYVPAAPTSERFAVRASAAVDPQDPTRGWVTVEAAAPIGKSTIPLRITLLLDVSSSMESVPMRQLPPLQDDPVPTDATSRLDLAKEIVDTLVARMPSRGEIAVVAFAENRARVLLTPTPIDQKERIQEAVSHARAGDAQGSRTPLETVYDLAGSSFDPCADHRVLLITDDNAHLHGRDEKTHEVVQSWAERGLELWTLSLGLLGADAPPLADLTQAGGGVHVYADTRSEAVEPLVAALRASGAVAREPAVTVDFGPEVTSWRRVATGALPATGTDRFALPETVEGGWRESRLYEVTLAPPAAPAVVEGSVEPPPAPPTAPWATVSWRVGSPVPGDWTREGQLAVSPTALVDADPALRQRVYAVAVARATVAEMPDWAALDTLGEALAREPGPAVELRAWTHVLSSR